jgi:hypothetical protein
VNHEHIRAECIHRRGVRLAPSANGDVDRRSYPKRRQQVHANELAKSALEHVPIDRRVRMEWDDDPDAGKSERGSENSRIEVHGPNSLPLSNDGL